MSEHTPGPWRAVARAVDNKGEDDPFLGWDIEGPEEAQRGQFVKAADARLMAAAPEMYDALKAIQANEPFCWDKAFRVIAKAEGRES